MTGYVKGTTPDGEMAHMDEAFYKATAAIRAWPDTAEAWKAAKSLADLIERMRAETAAFRDWITAYMSDAHGLTHEEIAALTGVSRAAISQRIARAKEKGYPVTEPATLPEQPHVGLAIITSPDQRVLIAKRRDGIPPWTFLGGDVHEGESAGDALRRRVQAESGLLVESFRFIGRRIHPKTSRVMVYCHVGVAPGEPVNGDPEDLEEVRWATIDETRDLMPDMYGPVRMYLDELQRQPQE